MIFKRWAYKCEACGAKRDVFQWDTEPVPECCGQPMQETHLRLSRNLGVIDDQVEGGPRWFENLGHEPVWIDSKSTLKREMEARNLQFGGRHDAAWHAKNRKMHDERLRDEGDRR